MSSINYSIKDSIAVIRFTRADKLNAVTREMALSIQAAIDKALNDASVRVIMLTGEGRAFSAGQDIAELCVADPGMGRILSEQYNPIISRIAGSSKPVVAAVNGVAAGAGANIALCCDIVVATKSASFIQAFSKIGLVPDSGGTYFLPRLIGWQKASAIMMLGDKISAEEAERIGMIYKYFEDDQFEEAAFKIAKQLAELPALALSLTKKALQSSACNSLSGQLAEEDELQQQAAAGPEYAERIRAFMKK
ncbi:MAG: enoyl-CoA hydratase-related protein [Flavitalea sp.]